MLEEDRKRQEFLARERQRLLANEQARAVHIGSGLRVCMG